jgi:hypothetical protein
VADNVTPPSLQSVGSIYGTVLFIGKVSMSLQVTESLHFFSSLFSIVNYKYGNVKHTQFRMFRVRMRMRIGCDGALKHFSTLR